MDPMQLAQLKRQAEWHAEQVRHSQAELRSAELALENAKKKVEELKKKFAENKRKLDLFNTDVVKAEEEVRRKIAADRQEARS